MRSDDFDDRLDVEVTLDYIDIGILGSVDLYRGGRTRAYVLGGPVFGIRIGEDLDANINGEPFFDALFGDSFLSSDDPEVDLFRQLFTLLEFPTSSSDLLRRSPVGLSIGAGVSVGPLFGEVRFTQGLTSVLRDADALIEAIRALPEPFGGEAIDAEVETLLRPLGSSYDKAKMREVMVLGGVRF